MKRKRITQIFPWLLPIRKYQRKFMFYLTMKIDGKQYSQNLSNTFEPYKLFETSSPLYNNQTGFDMTYQENKVFNLKLAVKALNGLLIKPNETFSFWQAIQFADRNTPYKDGLVVVDGKLITAPGGGMCQMSSLLFWIFLHSPLTIIERHSHNIKNFPDTSNNSPKGIDATVSEGWLDLKVHNNTTSTFQLKITFDEENIYGYLFTDFKLNYKYEIKGENLCYFEENGKIYEKISIFKQTLNNDTYEIIEKKHLYDNLCKIGYDLPSEINIIKNLKTTSNNEKNIKEKPREWCFNNKYIKSYTLVLIMVLLIIGSYTLFISNTGYMNFGKKQPKSNIETNLQTSIDIKSLNSSNAILMELESGKIISENNSTDKIYPASMTKIMTTILTIENTLDINKSITIPQNIFKQLYNVDASMAGFKPNEYATIIDLLYGVMLPSGAECCFALANEVSGSEKKFVQLMNKKAKQLGMNNTHFCNSTGLHDNKHYTTVKDTAILLQYSLQNKTFREIFTSSYHNTKPNNIHPNGLILTSTFFKYMIQSNVMGGKILGGKTGYTKEAGLCLASLANIQDIDYILVTAGAKGNHKTQQFHILDAIYVYNQIGETIVKTQISHTKK